MEDVAAVLMLTSLLGSSIHLHAVSGASRFLHLPPFSFCSSYRHTSKSFSAAELKSFPSAVCLLSGDEMVSVSIEQTAASRGTALVSLNLVYSAIGARLSPHPSPSIVSVGAFLSSHLSRRVRVSHARSSHVTASKQYGTPPHVRLCSELLILFSSCVSGAEPVLHGDQEGEDETHPV